MDVVQPGRASWEPRGEKCLVPRMNRSEEDNFTSRNQRGLLAHDVADNVTEPVSGRLLTVRSSGQNVLSCGMSNIKVSQHAKTFPRPSRCDKHSMECSHYEIHNTNWFTKDSSQSEENRDLITLFNGLLTTLT